MKYFPLFVSQVIMLGVGLAAEISPSLGAILASAPTGTPLALWLSTEGKSGVDTYKALLEFTEGAIKGTFCLMAFAIAARVVVLQAASASFIVAPTAEGTKGIDPPHKRAPSIFVILALSYLAYFAFYYGFDKVCKFQKYDDMVKKAAAKM